MFQLTKHEAVITHAMVRVEKAGKKERKPAASISVAVTGGNELLDSFEPGLAKTFFRKAAKGKAPQQGDLGEQQQLMEGSEGLVVRKHPLIAELPIQFEKEGYEFEIEPLNDGEDPIFHVGAKVFDCSAEMFEGGSVTVKFKLSFPIETTDAGDLLRAWIREKVDFTLTPPSKQEGGQTVDGADGDALDPDTDPSKRNP